MRSKLYIVLFIFIARHTFITNQNVWCQTVNDPFASNSVLSSGQWYKIAVVKDGIYTISYSDLVNLGISNPANVKIYGNNFGQLSYYNNDDFPDDLKEIPTCRNTGSDHIFNDGDYLLFYGQGTDRFEYNYETKQYEYTKHNYSDTAYYFLTSDDREGKAIKTYTEPCGQATYFSSESDLYFIHEEDSENILKSGREWYEPVYPAGITIDPDFSDLIKEEKLSYRLRAVARAGINTVFRLMEDRRTIAGLMAESVNLYDNTGIYAQTATASGTFETLSPKPVFTIKFYNNGEATAKGWLDFIILQGRKYNRYHGTTTYITDSRSVGKGVITGFTVETGSSQPAVWDISDPDNPLIIEGDFSCGKLTFPAATDSLRKYIIFNPCKAAKPIFNNKAMENQNLHGSAAADMLIVTHPLFEKYANQIAALHLKNDGLSSIVTTPEKIYNEFSGGIPDISAIRNFVRMKYKRQQNGPSKLQYLLLFGDGSYENKTLPPKNPNFIPTYQSANSTIVVSSFTSDDFYTLLDDEEGESEGTEDIGVGRLPVSDTAEAGIAVRKIQNYLHPANKGDWKNKICMVADDGDDNIHLTDADNLSKYIDSRHPEYNIRKIYTDAYRQSTTATGESYPDAVKDINNTINSGCLVFNYSGHGSENGLSSERIVNNNSINTWTNGSKMPVFIIATCEFSRFDNAIKNSSNYFTEQTSSGENVLLTEKGGGIALMSTARVAHSSLNYLLNRNIFKYLFDRDEEGKALRLGDIFRLAKNDSGASIDKRNFSLLGDPALPLIYPEYGKVITDSINGVSVSEPVDTLKALSTVTVSGHIEDNSGNDIPAFNGTVSVTIYDKAVPAETTANDGGNTTTYDVRENILFKGKTKAANGRFRFSFIMPVDMDYNYGKGKISYYASDSLYDMNGCFTDIVAGGFTESSSADTTGPKIRLFMNDTLFKYGGITGSNPVLLSLIEDADGINASGSGIGHDIVCYIDNNTKNSICLNSYYESNVDNYTKGKVTCQLSNLTKGKHYITLKVWDNKNNSSVATMPFVVQDDNILVVDDLEVYPNPAHNERITFSASHNRPGKPIEITITIFNINGHPIHVIRKRTQSDGYRLEPILWDGRNSTGCKINNGIYPFRLEIKTDKKEKAAKTGRIIFF